MEDAKLLKTNSDKTDLRKKMLEKQKPSCFQCFQFVFVDKMYLLCV